MIQVGDKHFEEYLTEADLQSIVTDMADRINKDYAGKDVLVIGILNGAFLFLADLVRALNFDLEISFVKYASYEGTATTGTVRELIGIDEGLEGRHILIVEDIVDTGNTLAHLMALLKDKNAASVDIATMFLKPEAFKADIPLAYVGKEIPNLFVVGYGMDYNGRGRNLTGLYQLKA